MVFADVYPGGGVSYRDLVEGVGRLKLSDASLTTTPVSSPALGSGLRLGFLGLFHIEITMERLKREYGLDTIVTLPTVEYDVITRDGQSRRIKNANDLPDPSLIQEIREPMARVSLFTPKESIGPIMQVLERRRGTYQTTTYLGQRAQLSYIVPLAELMSGFFNDVKSVSRGFATFDYELTTPQPVDAIKLTFLINHEPVESLSRIVVRDQAESIGRTMVRHLKDLMPSQQFAVPIQAAIGSPRSGGAGSPRGGAGGDIIARETKKALRKDVTAKLYGGDQTRKDKLLKKQKKGKKKLARLGIVTLPNEILTKLAQMQ